MNISYLFIKRPITTTLIMAAVLLAGIASFRSLPISDLPNVDFPTVQVTASLPGANPETMASAVATPLERQFSQIDGLDSMTSLSTLGFTQITLSFSLRRSIKDVPPDVEAAITRAAPLLPPGMPQPPTYQKVNPADTPVFFIALSSRQIPVWQLNEYADTLMAQRLSMINGVAQVGIFGTQKYAVHVQLNPDAMASRGVGINEVVQAISAANVNLPVGTMNGLKRAYTIRASGQLYTAAPYEDIIVAQRNGAQVRVRDIGKAIDSVEDDKQIAWFTDKDGPRRAVILAVQRQPGANVVAVVDEVKRVLPQLQAYLPPSVEAKILFDRSQPVRNSVADVESTLILSFMLVVLVVFFSLRNLSATIIPVLALPLSIIGTFAAMNFLGFTLDNLSLMALTLCIGFVVDDAIVMLENIVRHMEHGEPPMQAALKGSKEIGFTILSMTISLMAVFIPVLFMGGIVGRLFNEFAIVICVAILISGIVSLTLTPMMCSRFLRPPGEERHGFLYKLSEGFFNNLQAFYKITLQFALRHKLSMLFIFALTLLGTGWFFSTMSKGFIPDDDTDQMFAVIETAQGTAFGEQIKTQQKLMDIVRADTNNVQAFMSAVGGPFSLAQGGPNFGRMFFHLTPHKDRAMDVFAVIQKFRAQFAKISDARVFMQNPPMIRLGGRLSKALYQFAIQSPDLDELYRVAPMIEQKMRDIPLLQDVTSDLQIKNPLVNVSIDRDKATTLGITPSQIEDALSSGYSQRWISTIYAPNNQYKVLVELDPKYQIDPALLNKLFIKSINGQLVRLDTIAKLEKSAGVQSIAHLGQLPAVTISFNLAPGVSLGDAVDKVNETARKILPATMSTAYQGTAQAFQSSFAGMGWLLVIAIVFIYIVLGVLYESFIHPITILSGLPAAGLGALATLTLFHFDLNVYSFVGLIMLIGIVKKNAIMQIDFALQAERNEGLPPQEAIVQGCLIRFRPIMMTTLAALLGTLPIAIGIGASSGSRRPIGLTVVGGLVVSQVITLYFTPVFYIYLDKLQRLLMGRRAKNPTAHSPASHTSD